MRRNWAGKKPQHYSSKKAAKRRYSQKAQDEQLQHQGVKIVHKRKEHGEDTIVPVHFKESKETVCSYLHMKAKMCL